MISLSDIVRDAQLGTKFEGDLTIHLHDESDDEQNVPSMQRSENWQPMGRLARGGYGDVWLQRCVPGARKQRDLRTVKIVPRSGLGSKRDNDAYALDAIATLSRKRKREQNVLMKSRPPAGDWWIKFSDFSISKCIEESAVHSNIKGVLPYDPLHVN
ncbi:hypothetical protein F5Y16DRAFT_63478 [Xylariaceae sp. FL0255]|nr:hypothetical protein F5Y16DRAFT_63478 [Xylariaceae sp. FL0255]